jgi:hypothetical protein
VRDRDAIYSDAFRRRVTSSRTCVRAPSNASVCRPATPATNSQHWLDGSGPIDRKSPDRFGRKTGCLMSTNRQEKNSKSFDCQP